MLILLLFFRYLLLKNQKPIHENPVDEENDAIDGVDDLNFFDVGSKKSLEEKKEEGTSFGLLTNDEEVVVQAVVAAADVFVAVVVEEIPDLLLNPDPDDAEDGVAISLECLPSFESLWEPK